MRALAGDFVCLICFLCFLCHSWLAFADELRLKDGTKIVGTVVGFENNSFKVETSYGFALVRKDKVDSIVLSESKEEIATIQNKKPAAPAKAAEPSVPFPTKKEAAPQATGPPASSAAPVVKPSPEPLATASPERPVREEVAGNYYVNHTYGLRMYKPPSWHIIEGAQKMLPTAITALGTSDETTLLVMGRERLESSLDAHAAGTERRLRELCENYRALGEKRTMVAGSPALQRRFHGTVEGRDWSGLVISIARGNEVFTILGITYADSDLIQIQENVIAKAVASLEFTNR